MELVNLGYPHRIHGMSDHNVVPQYPQGVDDVWRRAYDMITQLQNDIYDCITSKKNQ